MSSKENWVQDQISKLKDFAARESSTPEVLAKLEALLDDAPSFVEPTEVLPIHEAEERIRLGRKIFKTKTKKSEWTVFDVSVLMFLPMETLKEWETHRRPFLNIDIFFKTARFARKFLMMSEQGLADLTSNRKRTAPESEASGPDKKKDRSEKEKLKTYVRDGGQCVLLHTADPDSAHIMPYSLNHTKSNWNNLKDNIGSIFSAWWPSQDDEDDSLLTDSIACSDRVWNQICLNQQLHTWWRYGYWCFRCLGFSADDRGDFIQLQFLWGKRQGNQAERWDRKIDLNKYEDGRPDEAIDFIKNWYSRPEYGAKAQNQDPDEAEFVIINNWYTRPESGAKVETQNPDEAELVMMDSANGHPLVSGQTLKIYMPAKECAKMKLVIDLQFALIQICNMAGAAGSPDFFLDEDMSYYSDTDSDQDSDTDSDMDSDSDSD
ncbi:hypothetical protein QBC37DRAFT_405561 [Rhypophila decipiens]|uniref:HNH nuclease domain-containing protein n=1 Tax=Rhypophila decipiens TaxID=261697 RepID=A0AAN7B328_9PEZI|nr:hypothetical protein QBC37DRAFT_405561 [Rhypophila decipiens]